MNWLAHVFLSENHIEYQLGNLLTDPLKGKGWEGASDYIYQGIETHKLIDSFTDSHPMVSKSKARLTERGHLKGVVIDILHDHFLSLHWNKFSNIPLDDFLYTFRTQAPLAITNYPPRAKEVIGKVVKNQQLGSYIKMKGVHDAFGRIDKRLSERALKKDTATRYIPLIKREERYLEEDFLTFFPDLMDAVHTQMKYKMPRHWKTFT